MWRCLVVSDAGPAEWRTLDAPSRESAVSRLIADGLVPLDLKSGKAGFAELLQQPVRFSRRLPVTEQALILRQLATLTESGVPIDRALDLLADQSAKGATRRLLRDALSRVRQGGSLAAALDEAKAFPPYVAGVIRAAERGGRLGQALASLAERLELAATTRRQLVTALSYPAAVLVATISALLVLLTMVVPQFSPIFEGEEARLPMLTQMVLAMSKLAIDHGDMVMLITAGCIIAAVVTAKRGLLQLWLAPALRRIGLLSLRDQYLAAQFASILGTLLLNGLLVVDALPLVRGAIGSPRWQAFLIEVEREIRAGHRLSAALARGSLLPPTVSRLIEVGEQGGRVGATSLQAGIILSDVVKARIERLVALVNPIAIVSLGGLVGLLVAGVMLGIFAMGDFAG